MLLPTVFTLSASTTFSFTGGSLNEFVSALAEASGKSVVVLADTERAVELTPNGPVVKSVPTSMRKGEARWTNNEEMLQALTEKWNMAGTLVGDVVALWPKAWPEGIVHQSHADEYRSAFERVRPSAEAHDEATMSFKTSGRQALLVVDARYLPGGDALEVHWFYAWAYLSVCAEDARPDDLLAAIAAACGAKIARSERSTSLVFDPQEFRKRAIAKQSQNREQAKNEYERATADFVIEALRALTDADLREAFSREDASVVRVVPEESALMAAFRARVASIGSLESDPRAQVSLLPALRALVSQMDLDAPLRIEYVNPIGAVTALVKTKSGDATIHF